MTGGEIAQVIVSVATLVTAIGGVLIGLRNSRKINDVHDLTNGKMDKFLAVTKTSATAEGHLAGVAEERAATNGPPQR